MMGFAPSSLVRDPAWSEQWGQWSARAAAGVAWMEQEPCLFGRYAVAPQYGPMQLIPSDGYLAFNLRLVPGSVIWGLWSSGQSDVQVMIRDLSLGHDFFQEPVTLASLRSDFSTGREPSFTMLPCPHPVVGDAMLRFEFWGPADSRVWVYLGGGEVQACPKEY